MNKEHGEKYKFHLLCKCGHSCTKEFEVQTDEFPACFVAFFMGGFANNRSVK